MENKYQNTEVAERIETIRRNPKMHEHNSLEAMDFCCVNGTVHLDILRAHDEHAGNDSSSSRP